MDSVARYAGSAQSVTPPSGAAWSNPGNATGSSGSNSASASISKNDVSQTLLLTNYGFDAEVPLGANITGIEVRVRRQASSNNVFDNEVQLQSQGGPTGTIKAGGSEWGTSTSTAIYGGAADGWGVTLTPDMVRDPSFGVGVSVENRTQTTSRTTQIYWVEIVVYYEVLQPDPPTGLTLNATGPTSISVSWNEPD